MKNFFYILFLLLLVTNILFAQKEYRLNSIKFRGNKILKDDILLNQINTQAKKKFEKLLIWKRSPEFTSFVLENDINRLKNYYNRNGFLNPEIGFNLDTIKNRRINVIINIKENEFVKINQVNIDFNGDTLNQEFLNSVQSNILVKSGERFVDENIFKSEVIVKQVFGNNGYPFSDVNYKIKLLNDNQLSDINLKINSGEKSFIGDVSIIGDSIVPQKFINKHIAFTKGDLYNQKIIDKSQQNLFDTELFQYVVIRSLKDSVKSNQIPVEVHVKELPRWAFETGLGYGTDDRFRLSLTVTKLNFLGLTGKLIFKGKTSYFTPYNFELKFIQANLFIKDLNFIVNPFYIQEREESYEIERIGGGLTLQHIFSKMLNSGLTYTFEKDNILEISDLQLNENEVKHNKSSITWGTQINTTNNNLNPTNGTKFNSNLSYSGLGFNSQFHYYKIDFIVRKYFSFNENLTIATKVNVGVMQALKNDSETPIEDRYFSGGASSLRGWGRHDIYPFNIDGFAIGGNSLLEGSIELRFPIYDILNGAIFVDLGNVWSESYKYDLSLLHYNTGLGLRVKTPIGPVRLDVATPFINDDFGFQFFISIGHAF